MGDPLDKATAVSYGKAVCAAYTMYSQSGPDPLHPLESSDFPSDYHMTAWIHMSDFAVFGEKIVKLYGYIARHNSDEFRHLLVVRGTEGAIEWWDDAVLFPVRFRPVPSAGLVHCGFDRIYGTMRVVRCPRPIVPGSMDAAAEREPYRMQGTFADQIEQLIGTIPAKAPDAQPDRKHQFSVMAHSLGGALCTLYVVEHAIKKRANPNRQVVIDRLCTFASPRVGMRAFTTAFDSLPIDSWRIANMQDIVPKVPPSVPVLLPYQHVATGYEFSSAGVVKFNPVCWHSMLTYLHWLDPEQALDEKCETK